MRAGLVFGTVALAVTALSCLQQQAAVPLRPFPGERHLANIRQLTSGGENAEAYFSTDGPHLIFQSTWNGGTCDEQFIMGMDGSNIQRVPTESGKTTCGYFFGEDQKIFFASTHAIDTACFPKPDASEGYVWRLDPDDIYTANTDGHNLQRLTHNGVYPAEGTLSPDRTTIVFTLLTDGDLDIYTMKTDGSGVRRLTTTPGSTTGAYSSHLTAAGSSIARGTPQTRHSPTTSASFARA